MLDSFASSAKEMLVEVEEEEEVEEEHVEEQDDEELCRLVVLRTEQ